MPASMPLSAVGRKQHAKYDPWLFVDRPSSAQRQKNAAGSAAAAPAPERPAPAAPAVARAIREAPLRRTRHSRAAPPRAALAGGGSRRRRRPPPPQYFNLASHGPALGGQPKYSRWHTAAACGVRYRTTGNNFCSKIAFPTHSWEFPCFLADLPGLGFFVCAAPIFFRPHGRNHILPANSRY